LTEIARSHSTIAATDRPRRRTVRPYEVHHLEIVRAKEIALGQYTYTGVTNSAFVAAGGSIEAYSAGRKYAIAQRWFEIDSSGTRIILLQAGAAL
jgi:hypothetical protein